ncbi:DEAD-domain-containing protein, partial [Polyplosphaeria fusca]
RRTVRLEDLQWKEVALPDRLDDFEGFFGLEEIDDVHVVRDEENGKVSFATAKHIPSAVSEVQEDLAESDAWEGFSDQQSSTHQHDEEEDKDSVSEPTPPPLTSNANEKQAGQQEPLLEEGGFAILADTMEEFDDESGEEDTSAWDSLSLSSRTLRALAKLKFSKPTPIQQSTIPEIMAGHDVIGKAATGSGKTLAFGIPILEAYMANSHAASRAPLALIIAPTRELAHQLSAHLSALFSGVGDDFKAPYIATITGGLSIQKQQRRLEHADIVVATPGRLWEVISDGHGVMGALKQIRFLVVDEADRLLSEGHYKELGEVLHILERDDGSEEGEEEKTDTDTEKPVAPEGQRQTLVFSATFHKGLQQKLAGKASKSGDLMNTQQSMEYLLKKLKFRESKPKFVDANPTSQMASGLREGLVECAGMEKDLYLYSILLFEFKKRALIFTNSISAVRRLTPFLQNLNLPALPLHSQMPQKARLRSVERFTEKLGSILVATDVAARGLDISGVQLVIHYHLPRAADAYVHRSGRTARGEAYGTSILICAPEEVAGVRRLAAKVHARSRKPAKDTHFMRTLDIDRRIVARLKPRATLAKKLADAVGAKEKQKSTDDVFKQAAEDLGIDLDEMQEEEAPGRRGRGSGRKKKEKEASATTKGEMQAMRGELKALLSQRINTGVSAKYLTSGGIDVDALVRGKAHPEFLGQVPGLGFEDE